MSQQPLTEGEIRALLRHCERAERGEPFPKETAASVRRLCGEVQILRDREGLATFYQNFEGGGYG